MDREGNYEIMEKDDIEVAEISELKEATFIEKDPSKTYWLACGDDRNATAESADNLNEAGVESIETAIRYYGALAGISRVLATTLVEQYGSEALEDLPDDFVELMKEVQSKVEGDGKVRMSMHTAESNEGNSTSFDAQSEQGVGCAYAAGAKVVTEINASSANKKLTSEEYLLVSGQEDPFDRIADANTVVADHYFGGEAAGLSRRDYVEIGVPVEVLAGSHARADVATAVVNFKPDRISNPRHANEDSEPFYNNDVTQVAEMLIKAFPDHQLDPETLIKVMLSDIAATRTALAAQDNLQPTDLRLEVYGSYDEAVEYLQSVSAVNTYA